MSRDEGFTIIELIVVIIIIGILLTIGISGQIGVLRNARDSERANDIADIGRQLENTYRNRTVGSPSYPNMNTFVSDARNLTGTAFGAAADTFRAPGESASSLIAATDRDPARPLGDQALALNQYVYQAFTSDGTLCAAPTDTCVRYRLFYRRESNNALISLKSEHQQ